MLLLGILSLVQVIFIPGFLLLRLLNFQSSYLKTIILSFGLSLTINYYLVLLLTSLGMYVRLIILAIFFLEVTFLFYSYRSDIHNFFSVKETSWNYLQSSTRNILNAKFFNHRTHLTLTLISQCIALVSIYCLAKYYFFDGGLNKLIFSDGDAVVSWNRWAIDWFSNTLPKKTWEYPQLLPTNVSITYKFIGTSFVHFFGKVFYYTFPFIMIACLWDLGEKERKFGYFFAITFLIIFLVKILGMHAVTGHADLPVACMGLITVYSLLIVNVEDRTQLDKNILISVLLAIGTAATKQFGIFLVGIFPLLLYLLALNRSNYENSRKIKIIVYCILACIVLITPWYIYKFLQIYYGNDIMISNRLIINGGGYRNFVHPTIYQKFLYSLSILNFSYKEQILILFSVFWVCLHDRTALKLTIIIAVPVFLIWSCFFSYDERNLSFVLPFVSIILGIGLEYLLKSKIIISSFKYRGNFFIVIITSFILGIVFLNYKYDSNNLTKKQTELARELGIPSINNFLYSYFSKNKFKTKIITNYKQMSYVPEFASLCISLKMFGLTDFESTLNQQEKAYILVIKKHFATRSTIDVEEYLKKYEGIKFVKLYDDKTFMFYSKGI